MNNIVSAELFRLKYNKTFYVCLLLAIFTAVLGTISTTSETAIASFEGISGNITLFLAIIVAAIACEDYENGTLKNVISSGNSRTHIYCGKLLTAIFVGFIYFIIDGLVSISVGYFYNGLGNVTAMEAMESLVAQLIMLIIYVFIFFGLSAISKSSKVGLMLGIAFTLFAALIPYLIGSYVTHSDLSAFSLDTLTKSVAAVQFSSQMMINFAIYGALGIALNLVGFLRLKKEEV